VRQPRSIIFYAWATLAVQFVLTGGVIVFLLVGGAYQRSAAVSLRNRVQAFEVANLVMVAGFLQAQQAARGYQATGDAADLRAYHQDRAEFTAAQNRAERLVWAAERGDVLAEVRQATSALAADGQAIAAARGSARATRLYAEAAAGSQALSRQADRLRQHLAAEGDRLAARNEQLLGVGVGWTVAILALGLMLPVAVIAIGLRWISGPLHGVTTTVRRLARGEKGARAAPGGPADVRDLASSLNYLADESDRARAVDHERARLQAEVHEASVRIREHLRADAIIREAVTAIRAHLAVGSVRVGLVTGDRLTLGDTDPGTWGPVADIVEFFPPDAVGWTRDVYRHRTSYRVQDFGTVHAGEVPPEIKEYMASEGATALLLTPFGAGQELLGCLTLTRNDAGQAWTEPEIEAIESLARDIGQGLEHARLYEAEERLVAELRSLDRAKATFLASASHDLRTPLTSILGYVELLSDGGPGPVVPAQAKMLAGVDRNARRLKTMIEDMLTMSKIELGAFASRLHPLDLTDLLPAAADVIKPSAVAGGLSLDVTYPQHAVMVDGDVEQLDRVLVNLLSNAVKYTPRGGSVALALACLADMAVLTVADTGIGIPEKDQGPLFTRFFRASNAVEAAIPGSGLGLSIVRTIVANHHGDISVQSAQDRGTTITVRVPLLTH
jgi:signal transduction histidine kinase